MKYKITIGILVIGLILIVGCSTINSESQAKNRAEEYTEKMWLDVQTDPQNCIKPPCDILKHWVRTTEVLPYDGYWIVTVEIETYDPKSEAEAKTADSELVRKVMEQMIYVKKYFDVKVAENGQVSCLRATSPYHFFTPCEEREEYS